MPSKVQDSAKESIIVAFLSGDEDFLVVAKILYVNSSTAYTIVARGDQAVQNHFHTYLLAWQKKKSTTETLHVNL